MRENRSKISLATLLSLFLAILLSGCATQSGYHGAGIGAITGSTAGALLDSSNPWRGAVIGGGLGAAFGGALTDRPYYGVPYDRRCCYPARSYYPARGYYPSRGYYDYPYYSPYAYSRRYTEGGAVVGGLTGAAAGAMLDHNNRWRGGMVGGFLGSLFGGGIGWIHSRPGTPVLHP